MITPAAIEIPTAADSHATRFSTAITRLPAASAINGLRTQNTGAVDINLMAKQHNDYQEALQNASVFSKFFICFRMFFQLKYTLYYLYVNHCV